MRNVKEELKAIRTKHELTQKEIAEVLEMPLRTYENWESGNRRPSEWIFNLVMEMLEIKLEGEKKMTRNEERAKGKEAVKGQVKYIVSQEQPGGDTWDKLFDTLEEANEYAENEFNSWCENDRKKNNLVVYEVKGEDLNDDAFDGWDGDLEEISWTCYNSADMPGFEHYCNEYK